MTFTLDRRHRPLMTAMAAALSLLVSGSGCGDDSDAGPPPVPGRGGGGAAKKPKKKKKAKKGGKLKTYPKVAEELRQQFSERDFLSDVTGDQNRDPFRSYLLAQPLLEGDEGSAGVDLSEICPPERSKATKFSLRDLKLIGIVLRGTKSYALFRDSTRFGHIVRRGECLGKEKAVVNEIGVGYVSVEVAPETPQGTAAPPAQKRTIALYPEELSVDALQSDEPIPRNEEPLPEKAP